MEKEWNFMVFLPATLIEEYLSCSGTSAHLTWPILLLDSSASVFPSVHFVAPIIDINMHATKNIDFSSIRRSIDFWNHDVVLNRLLSIMRK